MSVPTIPLRAVAALFLQRQHLERPRGRRLTAERLARFAEDAGGLQLDSINVVDRAHYLTVWSRFGPYRRSALDRLAYRRRALFEYWAHAACLLPARHFRYWRRAMLDYRRQPRHPGWTEWLRRNRGVVRAVERTIRARGPLASADFGERRPAGSAGGWWSRKPAARALDYLWMSGRMLVHSRVHFQKRYDLAERVMPEALALDPPDRLAFLRWQLGQALRALGAATEADLRQYFTFPPRAASEWRAGLAALVGDGTAVEIGVEVNGERPARWFALAADAPDLASAAARRRPSRGTTLLSPFDSFLWHRARTARLFGFDYRLEVYTPGQRRVHGYYTLPVLHDGQLIGRLDAKVHRDERRLEARAVHFERWFVAGAAPPAAAWGAVERDAALAGLAEAVRSLATFAGSERITLGRVTPARLRAPLARELAAAT